MSTPTFKKIPGMGELPHAPASIFGGDGSPRQLDDIRQLLHPKTAEAIPALQKDIQNDVGPDPAELVNKLGASLKLDPAQLQGLTAEQQEAVAKLAGAAPAAAPPVPEVPEDLSKDVELYLVSMLGSGNCYMKQYQAAGGKVIAAFRTLTADEASRCQHAEKLDTINRRLAASLVMFRVDGKDKISWHQHTDPGLRLQTMLTSTGMSETMWRLLHALYRQFQEHVAKLEAIVVQPDFSGAAAAQP